MPVVGVFGYPNSIRLCFLLFRATRKALLLLLLSAMRCHNCVAKNEILIEKAIGVSASLA